MKRIVAKNKVILFDLDGTLVDTEKLAMKVIDDYCVEKRLFPQGAPGKNFSKLIVGRTWKSAIRDFLDQFSLSLDPVELENDLKSRYRKYLHQGVEWLPGVFEILSEFRRKSLFMGIVTGSSRDEVDIILSAHAAHSHFDQIWAAENYPEGKPSPVPFQTAFQQVQESFLLNTGMTIEPSDVLVFEDSIAGMESSHRAGFEFVQILHAHPQMPLDSRALFSIQDWRDLQVL